MRSIQERLENFSIPEPNSGCILFTGFTNAAGYGRIGFNGKTRGAHRVSLELSGVIIGENDVVMHLCDTPACINPAHLKAGTTKENTSDSILKGRYWKNRSKTPANSLAKKASNRCLRGHEFTKLNTYTNPGTGSRRCLTCRKDIWDKKGVSN